MCINDISVEATRSQAFSFAQPVLLPQRRQGLIPDALASVLLDGAVDCLGLLISSLCEDWDLASLLQVLGVQAVDG